MHCDHMTQQCKSWAMHLTLLPPRKEFCTFYAMIALLERAHKKYVRIQHSGNITHTSKADLLHHRFHSLITNC